MEGPITDSALEAMLQAALSRVDVRMLRETLQSVTDPRFPISKPIANALAALSKHRDPVAMLGRAQYRAALPYAAAVLAEPCLAAVIEALGEDADDPTSEQLLAAIDSVGSDYDDVIVAVMLASVAAGDMAASNLCFETLDTDERFGLTDWQKFERSESVPAEPRAAAATTVSPEQREARKAGRDGGQGGRAGAPGTQEGAGRSTGPPARIRSGCSPASVGGTVDRPTSTHPHPTAGGGVRQPRQVVGRNRPCVGPLRRPRS